MILIEQEKGSHHSTMQKGSPKRTSAQKCWRNIYSENIREGIGMRLKSYKQNLQWRVCQSLGLFKFLEALLTNMANLINKFVVFLLK